ncbi:phosphoribosyltransferase [Ideonella sp.]|uniref:phosphoribosyltransferase n=1 Tax=Ideonella sp. TaxID=1929293 RepID=UPI002B48D614|nr:phosphoribosyltransferase [Ideonella sp.]HJV70178.1 phosphoribosyltransferase [Ideonella sp.]
MRNELFRDRVDAGRRLAEALKSRDFADPLVLALPRGGVPVAAEVAKALKAPLDLLLVRKIGAPGQPELAIAAVSDGAEPVVEFDEETMSMCGATREDVMGEVPGQLAEIERRRQLYLKGRAPLPVKGRTVLLVDDGIATGTTVRAAIRALKAQGPARLVLAVPVAPASELPRLRGEVDELVCLEAPAWFGAVGAHYRHFGQTSDEEVVALMEAST